MMQDSIQPIGPGGYIPPSRPSDSDSPSSLKARIQVLMQELYGLLSWVKALKKEGKSIPQTLLHNIEVISNTLASFANYKSASPSMKLALQDASALLAAVQGQPQIAASQIQAALNELNTIV